MEDLADLFVRENQAKGHVGYLLRKSSFSILIQAGNISIPLQITKGEIKKARRTKKFDVKITGSEEAIHSIISGRVKLRDALTRKDIAIDTTFRKTLLLESFFCLGKIKISYENT
ncbi:hypothetical protein J7I93_04950 [Bacillus sp. ISL-47]|uniref:hypothetical protein n=1 Tax=Bacillus sp. ISL-47 TaxID=2819130 RepID=UPI001BE76CCB|nr:hypothetical protein [Bacillus sp. ISL-47]MBT2687528.1 hypothetical protein [Bacillus sp. ISL-47]MBT2706476.1 hypothetical protein [Pseudomonas sp. ISL-84]